MASVIDDPNGRKRIQFIAGDGKKKTIRLGKLAMQKAEKFKSHVEKIIGSIITGASLEDETSRWIAALEDRTHRRLAAVGLVKPRSSNRVTLAAFIDGYIKDRCDVKPATAIVLGHTRRNLVEFFGADKPLRDITPGEADQWRTVHLIGKEKLSDNTVRRRCGIAKQFFRAAIRRGLIVSNPFADLKAAVQGNKSREYFVSRAEATKVLDECPDAQWRLLFALSRYGGLRCPSEHLALKWSDIDWLKSRIRVSSPKTEHHQGKDCRIIPLFPELRQYLLEVFEQAEPGTEYVITKYRDAGVNLRTQLERFIKNAGLKAWPKLFQNLRSTRQTELAERYPIHVVCAWLGNSRAVAQEHYLQITDSHFSDAALHPTDRTDAKATQNPTPQPHAASRTASQSASVLPENPNFLGNESESMGDTGLEPVTSRV